MPCTPNENSVHRSIAVEGITCCWPRTIKPPSMRILPICLRIGPLIVVAGNRPRPGTKGMDAWNIVTSPVVLIEIAWFAKQWQGIEQVFRLQRTRCILKSGTIEQEVVYGLSSLSMRHAPPARMLSLATGHGAIENKLHYRRDGSLGEDACQTRTGPVPGLLAQLNSTVWSLMDRAGVVNVARQMRSFDAHPEQALALLLTGSCSVY